MYLCDQVQILGAPFILSLMYDRYTKPPSWRNLAKRPTLQRGSRDAAECADAGCTGATGTRGYGGCAGAAVLGCGRGVPLKTAVESSPWTERGAPKSALTHQKQTPFSSLEKKFKQRVAPWLGGVRPRLQALGLRLLGLRQRELALVLGLRLLGGVRLRLFLCLLPRAGGVSPRLGHCPRRCQLGFVVLSPCPLDSYRMR